jgi:hypothetical protein
MVFKKLGKIQGRKLVELNRICRPDGLAHRNDKMFDKKPRKLSGGQKIFEGQTIVIAFKKFFGLSSEFKNVEYHPIKRWAQQVLALDEKRIQRTGAKFKPGFFTLHAKAHVRRLPGNPQVFHQLDKIRIRLFVKDNKAGVHGIGCAIQADIKRVGVSADIILCLIDDQFMLITEQVCSHHACNAGSDDRDSHLNFSSMA